MRIKTDIQTIMYMEEQISQASIYFSLRRECFRGIIVEETGGGAE